MMPGELDGMGTLGRLRDVAPDLPVIMMSGRAGLADAVKATKLGAFNFLEKPLTPEGVLLAVSSALELRQTRRVARALRAELGFGGQMVGKSSAMDTVRQMIARVAPTDARVLITGESGTGKELVASAIHDGSPRREKPFVRVNCAAIPRDLVESEMFGHERGAFTGATQTRIGRFELAHHGTLFLDEVGDLGPDADDPALTLDVWRDRIRRHPGELKNLLKNQAFVAGIGNAYSDEILHAARLLPFRKRTTLAAEEIDSLYAATKSTVADAIAVLRERVPPTFEKQVRDFLAVHDKGGTPCPRCGTRISEVKPGGFVTSFCRGCQH